MFGDIFNLIFGVAFQLFGAALLLRAWMHAIRFPPFNPISRAIYQTTNWLIQPLERLLPSGNRINWTSWVAVWLLALAYLYVTGLLLSKTLIPLAYLPHTIGLSLIIVAQWLLNLVLWITVIQAILSWVNPMAPIMPVLHVLTAPLLNPIRRILPSTQIDFSPLVLLIAVQIGLMVLSRFSFAFRYF